MQPVNTGKADDTSNNKDEQEGNDAPMGSADDLEKDAKEVNPIWY